VRSRDNWHPGDLRFPGWTPPSDRNAADRRPERPPDQHSQHQHFSEPWIPEGERRTGRSGEFGANHGSAGRRPQNTGGPDDESYSRKIREADKIEVPPFPDITQIAPWRTKLMNSVAVASGNPDYYRVTIWLAESWSGKNLEELASSGGSAFVTLDLKLASAMTNMMHKGGERSKRFRDRVNLKMEEASKKGDIIKGRQIVWMLLDSFKTFDRSAVVYGFDHLSTLRVNNNDLHEFVIQWNHVLSNMGDEHIQTSLLRDAFYRKIERVHEVSYDLNIYERMAESDPNKTYEFLMTCVETAIRMQDTANFCNKNFYNKIRWGSFRAVQKRV